jgi:hypothetical protein
MLNTCVDPPIQFFDFVADLNIAWLLYILYGMGPCDYAAPTGTEYVPRSMFMILSLIAHFLHIF